MKNGKKAALLAAVFLVALAFGACSRGGSAGSGSAAKGGAREIVFWDMMWGPAQTYPAAMGEIVNRYNSSNPDNIHVTLQTVPWDNFYQVFLTAVTSKAAPDVSTGAFMQSIQFAEMGEGLSLDPIVDAWKEENNPILNDYSEAIFNLHMYDGKHYGLPWNLDTRQFTYRKDYFEKAGITKLPATWAEFEEACAKLKAALPADTYPVIFPGGGDYNGLHAIITFFVQNDTGATDARGNPDYLNPRITETLQFINRLYVKGYIPEGFPAYRGTDAEKLFQSGKAAMYLHNAIDLRDFPDIEAVGGILPPMAGPSGKAQNYTWVNAIEAFSQTKDPEACHAFIKWLLENEGELWEKSGLGALPARASLRQRPYFTDRWATREISELVLPTVVSVCHPSPSIFLPFSIIEGEAIPMIGMVNACVANPDYRAIQQDVQDRMLKAWAEFEM